MTDESPSPLAQLLTRSGQLISRYGLVVVLAWIGLTSLTAKAASFFSRRVGVKGQSSP